MFGLMVGLHGPLVALGLVIDRRRPVAIWTGAFLALVAEVLVVARMAGVIGQAPAQEESYDNGGGVRINVFLITIVLFSMQLLAYLVALISYYSNRAGQAE